MEKLIINGAKLLGGKIQIQGSKNSALPILAGTVLVKGECVIHNCPRLRDTEIAMEILRRLGCRVSYAKGTVSVDAKNICHSKIPEGLMSQMRSSIVFLGAILSRTGKAEIYSPGGCEIGLRPIDMHLNALRRLGTDIKEGHGTIKCEVKRKLCGNNIILPFPSVGATENILLASVVSKGITTVTNSALEPEIEDLVKFLNSCGGKITMGQDRTIIIEGVQSLHGTEYTVMPDRIVASTYMSAVAVTGGDVFLERAAEAHMKAVLDFFEQTGCGVFVYQNGIRIVRDRSKRLLPVENTITMPYPGFPTDAQAPVTTCLSVADGTSVLVENIFENRFLHIPYLRRFGAEIKTVGRVAIIKGRERLCPANAEATDLRGGGALVCAGLAAEGESTITNLRHIDRGYEKIEEILRTIGADIRRVNLNGPER